MMLAIAVTVAIPVTTVLIPLIAMTLAVALTAASASTFTFTPFNRTGTVLSAILSYAMPIALLIRASFLLRLLLSIGIFMLTTATTA